MSDIYKIAVRLTMEGNAHGFLNTLASHLLKTNGEVERLEHSLGRLRMRLAIGGGLAIAGGMGMLKMLKDMTDQAKELSHELASVGNMKLGALAGASLMSRADEVARRTTTEVPGTTEAANVRLFGESYSMFGEEGAAAINPKLARFGQAIGGSTGDYHGAEEGLYAMLRSGDLMGKLVNETTHKVDPEKLTGFLDTASKMIAATHGKVNTGTFLAMAQQGGPALASMSEEGLMSMAMVAQGMGGFRAGTAMSSLKQQMVGGTMGKSQAEALEQMGLINGFTFKDHKVRLNDHDRDTPFIKAMGTDMLKAVDILQKTLVDHGKTDLKSQTDENYQLFGRQTTQRIISDILRNLPQMMAERGRIAGAEGVAGQTANRNDNDYATVEHNLGAAWTNLMQAIAGPNSVTAIDVMKRMTAGLNEFTGYVRTIDPGTLVAIGQGLAGIGVALTVGGVAALVAAVGPIGLLVAGISALGGALVAYKWDALKQIGQGVAAQFNAIKNLDFTGWIKAVGTTILGEFHLLPQSVQGAIKSAISTIGSMLSAAIQGLVSAVSGAIGSLSALGGKIGGAFSGAKNYLGGLFHKSSLEGGAAGGGITPISDHVRTNSVPKASMIQANNVTNVHLDGKRIASVVTKNQVAAMEYPHAIGGHDGYGSYYPAGGTAMPS